MPRNEKLFYFAIGLAVGYLVLPRIISGAATATAGARGVAGGGKKRAAGGPVGT